MLLIESYRVISDMQTKFIIKITDLFKAFDINLKIFLEIILNKLHSRLISFWSVHDRRMREKREGSENEPITHLHGHEYMNMIEDRCLDGRAMDSDPVSQLGRIWINIRSEFSDTEPKFS